MIKDDNIVRAMADAICTAKIDPTDGFAVNLVLSPRWSDEAIRANGTAAMTMARMRNHDDEEELADDYPVYLGHWYVIDGKPMRSLIDGTVGALKRISKARRVRRCNAIRRGLQ